MQSGERALVTGGGGFLGKAIVERLLSRGAMGGASRGAGGRSGASGRSGARVRSFARGAYPELVKLGVEVVRGDLGDAEAVKRAGEGCDLVFHVAAKAGLWGDYADYHRINVVGTQNVIAACRAHGIERLIFTSSPSVVFNGCDLKGVDESAPYPERFEAHYPATKAAAERLVLAANDATLATVALRPHLILGPGDNNLAPRLIARARAGQLRLIGDGNNKVDFVFVDDAADAHVLAAERLAPGAPIAGKSYFITAGDPRPIRELINLILAAAGVPPVTKSASLRVARATAALMEIAHGVFHLPGEPRLTRWLVSELATAHWFDISAARRDLGYEPQATLEEVVRRYAEWLAPSAGSG